MSLGVDSYYKQQEDDYLMNQDRYVKVDETWDEEPIYIGDSILEFQGEKCFDDLENIREFLEYLGAERIVER